MCAVYFAGTVTGVVHRPHQLFPVELLSSPPPRTRQRIQLAQLLHCQSNRPL